MDARQFWYANFGRYLCPSGGSIQDRIDKALAQNYPHVSKASALRLGGAKAGSLVGAGQSILMADIKLPHPVPEASLKIRDSTWRTMPDWMAEIITSPPEPPFMFIIYGKNPNIQDRLRLNATRDVIEICGAENLRCRPAVVRKALETIGTLSPTVWKKAAYLLDRCERDPVSRLRDHWEAELDRLQAKNPSLSAVLAVLPRFRSGDYEATTLVYNVRAKNAARSSDEAERPIAA